MLTTATSAASNPSPRGPRLYRIASLLIRCINRRIEECNDFLAEWVSLSQLTEPRRSFRSDRTVYQDFRFGCLWS